MALKRTKKRIVVRRTERPSFARHIVWGVLFLCLIALVCVGVYYLTRLSAVTLQTVEVTGGSTIDTNVLRDEVVAELNGSYGRIVPHAFAFTYPHDAIVHTLLSHSRIYNPRVERVGLTHLSITFDEYVPYAVWCGRDTTKPCATITTQGFAFEETNLVTGGVLVRYVDESREGVSRGDTFPPEKLHAADTFIERAEKELGFRIGVVTYTKDGDIQFTINGGGTLLVSTRHDLNESFENIHTVLEIDEYKKLAPGNFQYIDARFPPKIFVNEAPADAASTTEAVSESTE